MGEFAYLYIYNIISYIMLPNPYPKLTPAPTPTPTPSFEKCIYIYFIVKGKQSPTFLYKINYNIYVFIII